MLPSRRRLLMLGTAAASLCVPLPAPPGGGLDTVLLCHCDGTHGSSTFVDSVGTATFTPGYGTTISTAPADKFGTGVALFGGGYACLDSSGFEAIGTDDFCIEGRSSSKNDTGTLFDLGFGSGSHNTGMTLAVSPADMYIIANDGGVTEIYSTVLSNAALPSGPYHWAVQRISGAVTVYINGVGYYKGDSFASLANTCMWGNVWNVGGGHAGWMDELRITKGIVYSGNFTPPTGPFS